MSAFTSSKDTEVEHDLVNFLDVTIDATNTLCLDFADLMMKGRSHVSKNSTLLRFWRDSFDQIVNDLNPRQRQSDAQSTETFSAVKHEVRNSIRNPARPHEVRYSIRNPARPGFDPDLSVSVDTTLADLSLEHECSAFFSYLDTAFVDQSHELNSSTSDSEEISSDDESSSSVSFESDDYLLHSIDDKDELPNVKKTRPRTVISITRDGCCVDQINMDPIGKQTETENQMQANNPEMNPSTSPSRSILTSDAELLLAINSDVSIAKQLHSNTPDETLDRISRTLFGVSDAVDFETEAKVPKHKIQILDVALPHFGLSTWFASKLILGDFPLPEVSHRLNALSKYNPFSSLLQILFENVLKRLEILNKNDDRLAMENGQQNEVPTAVTIIFSGETAYELFIDEERRYLSAYYGLPDDMYASLEANVDDASNDSDLTPKFCHHERVLWSP